MNTVSTLALMFAGSAIPFTSSPATFEYDANGNLTRVTDPLGRTASKQYDTLNRPVREQLPAAGAGTSAPSMRYTYDALDQLASVTDPRNLKTTYIVNGLADQLGLSSPDTGNIARTYDAAGNLISSTDARGQATTYTYDARNRLTRIAYASGIATTFEYGAASGSADGQLIRMTDESGETDYQYDAAGRLVSKTQTVRHDAIRREFKVNYSYGQSGFSLGKIDSITYPSGNRILLVYGNDGRVSDIYTTSAGSTASTILLRDIHYSPMGLPESWHWGNGRRYQRDFDLQGRLTRFALGEEQQGGTVRSLEYDGAGNIMATHHTRTDIGVTELDQRYAYDELDRLTFFNSNNTSLSFGYDVSSNRTQLALGSRIYPIRIAPASNRLQSAEGPLPAKTYTYDASGNLVSNGTFSFTYNARGRLSSSKNSSGQTRYLYNGMDERVAKTTASTASTNGSTYFIHDQDHQLIGEYDAESINSIETVYLEDMPVVVMRTTLLAGVPVASLYYIYTDQIKTPRVIANAKDNSIVWRWDHADPFGLSAPGPGSGNAFIFNGRFPGQYYDLESNLIHNRHRDYDPEAGRYIESDRLGLAGGLNTYLYADANPVSRIDPTGEFAIPAPLIIIAAGTGAYYWWMSQHRPPLTASQPGGIIPPQDFPGGISYPPKNQPQNCVVGVLPPEVPRPPRADCETTFNICVAHVKGYATGWLTRSSGYTLCLMAYAVCRKRGGQP
ncbi:hypothetical protein GCM10027277_38480 [Pseudoduganella ginsengisoli]|uniref:Type IV secretion protein Rhs n=1 Tax=Pseudoduganella ginsengisoli TaxID=1462440 RepID=A0A6L6PX97_9BURK|nr:RHS repeat-associated core domain-containing protein [Pseudoduganella ginsengisoli]MTW02080.1 type IV secretion protein Rhs [Pseudoduganella ginsengisoli]